MENLRKSAIDELSQAREDLLSLNKSQLTFSAIGLWSAKWSNSFAQAETLGSTLIDFNIKGFLQGYHAETDAELFIAIRERIIALLDGAITELNQQIQVKPILETLILKVSDPKLSALLREFNAAKETTPNLAALGFRTILSLVIRERAKSITPLPKIAQKDDIDFERDIKAAIQDTMFSSGATKLLSTYLNKGNKDRFDNVVHKSGANMLIDKDDLSSAIDLLNTLLPEILP